MHIHTYLVDNRVFFDWMFLNQITSKTKIVPVHTAVEYRSAYLR